MGEKDVVLPKAVRVIIEKDYKYLLVQQKNQEDFGLWNLPGGKVDQEEGLVEAAKREVFEETGYKVGSLEKIFEVDAHSFNNNVFLGKIVDGELKFQEDEVMNADWFSSEQIEAMPDKMRNDWTIKAIKKYEENFKNFA